MTQGFFVIRLWTHARLDRSARSQPARPSAPHGLGRAEPGRSPHGRPMNVIGEIGLEAHRDLFGAPVFHPAPIRPTGLTSLAPLRSSGPTLGMPLCRRGLSSKRPVLIDGDWSSREIVDGLRRSRRGFPERPCSPNGTFNVEVVQRSLDLAPATADIVRHGHGIGARE